MALRVLIRGGGDLASGVAFRVVRAGWNAVITELPQPMAVRRLVSFSQAIYDGQITIEGVTGRFVTELPGAINTVRRGEIAVMVDPDADIRCDYHPQVIIDARMIKKAPDLNMTSAPLVIGLGPGFVAGQNCHCVVETMRGPWLGHVIWEGPAAADTGEPDSVANRVSERVLRAPANGTIKAYAQIGAIVEQNQILAEVEGIPVKAKFRGVLRGLIQPGILVTRGVKIGDIDPRLEGGISTHISDKALSVGGGVLEAILSRRDLRPQLWIE